MKFRVSLMTTTMALGLMSGQLACSQPKSQGTATAQAPDLQDGDIVFQRSQSRQCKAVAAATGSYYTHMGIVFIENGKPCVYEAVEPISKTTFTDWKRRGARQHVAIKRLSNKSQIDFAKLKREVLKCLGQNYDPLFEWSDTRIYCSELVWKAYKRATNIELAKLRRFRDFHLDHRDVRPLVRERYGSEIPLDMPVIAPSDIFKSPHLVSVNL